MKQRFDNLTDLVEHVQDADAPAPQEPEKGQEVLDSQGEHITLDDKDVR